MTNWTIVLTWSLFILLFFSCSSTPSVVYIEPNGNIYEPREILYPNVYYFNKKKIQYQDYVLSLQKEFSETSPLPFYEQGGSYSSHVGALYSFFKNDEELFSVVFAMNSTIFTAAQRLFVLITSSPYIEITRKETGQKKHFDIKKQQGVFLQDSQVVPIIIRTRHQIYFNGKVKKLWLGMVSGLTILVNNEEYAIMDVMGNKPVLHLNMSFSQNLSDEEHDYVIFMALCSLEFSRALNSQDAEVDLPRRQ